MWIDKGAELGGKMPGDIQYIYIRIRKSWDNIYRADKRDISAGGSSRFAAYIVIISLLISRGPDPPTPHPPIPTLTQPCPSHPHTPNLFPPSTGFEQCIGLLSCIGFENFSVFVLFSSWEGVCNRCCSSELNRTKFEAEPKNCDLHAGERNCSRP